MALQIGVMMEEVQYSDIACIDIIGGMSKETYSSMGSFASSGLLAQATEMKFHYLSTTLEPARTTQSVHIVPTVTYDNAPRDLDILIIGGPMPSHRPAAADKFLKEATEKTKVILTTCTGSMWLASSGVLDGKKATTNRLFLGLAKQMYPNVDWVDQRWVVDGKFWTAGGASAGNDMVAVYALQNFHEGLAKKALEGLDLDPVARGQFYAS